MDKEMDYEISLQRRTCIDFGLEKTSPLTSSTSPKMICNRVVRQKRSSNIMDFAFRNEPETSRKKARRAMEVFRGKDKYGNGQGCDIDEHKTDQLFDKRTLSKAYKNRWYAQVSSLETYHPTLFSNTERVRLQETEATSGALYYKGIGVTIHNCLGLRRVYEVYFKSRFRNGEIGRAEFEKLRTTLSQFFRWAVSTYACAREDIWKEQTLFQSVADHKLVNGFMEFFIKKSSPGLVKTKSACLKRVCEVGILVLDDHVIKNQLELVSVVLQNITNASKRAHRSLCQNKKRVSERSTSAVLNPPTMSSMNVIKDRAIGALDYVMRSCMRPGEEQDIGTKRSITYAHLKAWSTNFIGLLMLVSGGQRPQVFGQLQVPTREECRRFDLIFEQGSYIELRTVDEKRPRYLDLPHLVLPATIIPYLKFHILRIRPAVQEFVRRFDNGPFKPLLLHDQTALSLKPPQITREWQTFLSLQDPSLRSVTAMSLRRDYATMILKCYREKKVFSDLTESEFLDKVSQQMNTSPEQLKRTYMGHIQLGPNDDVVEIVKYWGAFLVS